MEFQNVFQEMLNVTAAPPLNPVAAALQRAGIPADAPYYAGAFRNVEQALASRKPQSVAFWQAYLLSLCGHLERLEREAEPEDKPQERRQLHGSIQTVQAVLYALQETERTESEPRETDLTDAAENACTAGNVRE